MKRSYLKKTAAAIIAMLMAASLMTGCKNNGGEKPSEATSGSELISAPDIEYNTETRPIAEGDDYAINKINNKSPEDSLPGGYKLVDYDEKNQGKLYLNGESQVMSQVRIMAYNYNEDLLDMATWADNACANLRMSNIMMYAMDTQFKDPEDVKICGFDGIRYDTDMTQYTQFDENEKPMEEGSVKLKGRCYYFYSEQDAYAIIFETRAENWDEQIALFEEFVKDLEVTKTEY